MLHRTTNDKQYKLTVHSLIESEKQSAASVVAEGSKEDFMYNYVRAF